MERDILETKTKKGNGAVLELVADRARVSAGTVSRVFNNCGEIPPRTRIRVLASARELGFRPRVGIRGKQIALVTEPPQNTVMGGYVNTLTQYICFALSLRKASVSMITEDHINLLAESWFDGVIGIAWREDTIEVLKELHIPVVWFCDNQAKWFHTVYSDVRKTGELVGSYLLAKGHRKIAVIHQTDYTGCNRLVGVRLAMVKAGLDPERLLLGLETTPELLHFSVKRLIDADCSAVWVPGEDMNAIKVSWLIQELAGKRIPEDISLIASENPEITAFQRPALTAVQAPLREMAEAAVRIIMEDRHEGLTSIEMPVRLIERNSVAVLPAAAPVRQ